MQNTYNLEWLTNKYENGEVLKYLFFWGNKHNHKEEVGKFCFSQWFESPFTVENTVYPTAEHWMMAQKALLFGDEESYNKVINTPNPKDVKSIGRQIKNYDDAIWNKSKYDIVKTGNIHKFSQNAALADYLLKTGDRVLVEASPVDAIWGIGLSADSVDIENVYAWRGENLLGFALIEARDFLQNSKE